MDRDPRAWQPSLLRVLGATGAPLLVTGYLKLLGYRLDALREVLSGGAVSGPVAIYLLSLAALGVTIVVGVQCDLRPAVAVGVGGLLVLPWLDPFGRGPSEGGSVVEFMAPSVALLLGVVAVALGQFGVANRREIRDWLTPRSLRLGLVVGVTTFLVVTLLRTVVWGAPVWSVGGVGGLLRLWTAVGLVLLGAVPTILLVRLRLATPAILAGGLLVVAAALTLSGPTPGGVAATGSPLTYYAVGWFVPLALCLVAAVIEYRVRRRRDCVPAAPENQAR